MENAFDVVIIGAGLGGLLTGVMLSKNGYKVAIVEQNKQIGGCLQTFAFHKQLLDSCVHYIGSYDKGQTLHRIFEYAGINAALDLEKLDADGFDHIISDENNKVFRQAQGYDNFVEQLMPYSKNNGEDLRQYVGLLQKVGNSFPLFKLRKGTSAEKEKVMHWGLQEVLDTVFEGNQELKYAVTGNSLLYAGPLEETPFYLHALVNSSYVESAYKMQGASSQIAKALWRQLQHYGGVIFRNEAVTEINISANKVSHIHTRLGREITGKYFISNMHPSVTLGLINENSVKGAYRKRMQSGKDTVSSFMINIVLQEKKVAYNNYNVYWNKRQEAYECLNDLNQIRQYALYYNQDKNALGYASSVCILCYYDASLFNAWEHTKNITAEPQERTSEYIVFKERVAKQVMKIVERKFPEIIQNTVAYQTASPLTFRDYMGTSNGSMYGLMHRLSYPELNGVPTKSRISNLYFTGQNVNLHGVVGVSISSLSTVGEFVGLDYLLSKM